MKAHLDIGLRVFFVHGPPSDDSHL